MKLKFFLIFSLFICFFSMPIFADQKKILILNSYHKEFLWSDTIFDAIKEHFQKEKVPVEFFVEYMDTKRISSDWYMEKLNEIYAQKYAATKFDIIISTDDNALNFLIKNKQKLFPNVPVVFAGINNTSIPDLVDKSQFTGVLEDASSDRTIDLILKMHPDIKKIFVISDYTSTGNARKKGVEDIAYKYKNIVFEYSENGSFEQIKSKVSTLGRDSIILLLSFFNDSSGVFYDYAKLMEMLYPVSKVPIYCVTINYLGLGVIGGVVNNPSVQGRIAASMSQKIIDGTPVEAINIVKKAENPVVFDYNILKKFGIKPNELPPGTVVINKPKNFLDFYEEHKFWIVSMFMIFLLIITTILLITTKKIIKINKEKQKLIEDLQKALNEIKTLSGFIPICSSCKKIRDDHGYWEQIESYIKNHSNAEFTHSLCPDCVEKLYPEFAIRDKH